LSVPDGYIKRNGSLTAPALTDKATSEAHLSNIYAVSISNSGSKRGALPVGGNDRLMQESSFLSLQTSHAAADQKGQLDLVKLGLEPEMAFTVQVSQFWCCAVVVDL
jgi:hypothetical protein